MTSATLKGLVDDCHGAKTLEELREILECVIEHLYHREMEREARR